MSRFPLTGMLKAIWPALAISLALLAAACGGKDNGKDTVSLQLDWTPNTNHIGIYVALAKGWYKDAGLELDILPYTDAGSPDAIVANGQADMAISFPPSLVFSRAAGLDLVSVAAVLQRNMAALAVLDSSPIRRPRDFDGKTYAGFGSPYEEPQIRTVIKNDGGKGEFRVATLSTAAYEALYNGRADFTDIFIAWEGIEAGLRGVKLRTFSYASFGMPEYHSVIIVARQDNLSKKRDLYRRFLTVTQRGYEFAARDPEEAARVMLAYLPEEERPGAELMRLSAKELASAYIDSSGRWGLQDPQKWQAYLSWILGQGIVVNTNNQPVRALPGGAIFSNELLEAGGKY